MHHTVQQATGLEVHQLHLEMAGFDLGEIEDFIYQGSQEVGGLLTNTHQPQGFSV